MGCLVSIFELNCALGHSSRDFAVSFGFCFSDDVIIQVSQMQIFSHQSCTWPNLINKLVHPSPSYPPNILRTTNPPKKIHNIQRHSIPSLYIAQIHRTPSQSLIHRFPSPPSTLHHPPPTKSYIPPLILPLPNPNKKLLLRRKPKTTNLERVLRVDYFRIKVSAKLSDPFI